MSYAPAFVAKHSWIAGLTCVSVYGGTALASLIYTIDTAGPGEVPSWAQRLLPSVTVTFSHSQGALLTWCQLASAALLAWMAAGMHAVLLPALLASSPGRGRGAARLNSLALFAALLASAAVCSTALSPPQGNVMYAMIGAEQFKETTFQYTASSAAAILGLLAFAGCVLLSTAMAPQARRIGRSTLRWKGKAVCFVATAAALAYDKVFASVSGHADEKEILAALDVDSICGWTAVGASLGFLALHSLDARELTREFTLVQGDDPEYFDPEAAEARD